jgi:hypothetical protein
MEQQTKYQGFWDPLPRRNLTAWLLWFFAGFAVWAGTYHWTFHAVSIPFSVGFWALMIAVPFAMPKRVREMALLFGAIVMALIVTTL